MYRDRPTMYLVVLHTMSDDRYENRRQNFSCCCWFGQNDANTIYSAYIDLQTYKFGLAGKYFPTLPI